MSNKNSIMYRQVGDYKIPNLTLPPEEANITLGKWGTLHKDYLLNHKKVVFTTLLAEGKLWQYLADIDTQAQQMFYTLVEQMKEQDQMGWVCRMQNIEARARVIICTEWIYV